MLWEIEFTKKAVRDFEKLDRDTQKEIKKAILKKLVVAPEKYLIPLTWDKKGLYKFMVGTHRLICKKEKNIFLILVLKIGHRKNIYK